MFLSKLFSIFKRKKENSVPSSATPSQTGAAGAVVGAGATQTPPLNTTTPGVTDAPPASSPTTEDVVTSAPSVSSTDISGDSSFVAQAPETPNIPDTTPSLEPEPAPAPAPESDMFSEPTSPPSNDEPLTPPSDPNPAEDDQFQPPAPTA